tara:strand:- start:28 stop:306 length:279 start_codon:yes stop_codon:yes gene_type:complete
MKELHHYTGYNKILGPHKDLYNTENIYGNCTHIQGNAQNLTGDVSSLSRDVTGLSGDATGIAYYSLGNYLYIGDVTAMRASTIAGTPTAEVL